MLDLFKKYTQQKCKTILNDAHIKNTYKDILLSKTAVAFLVARNSPVKRKASPDRQKSPETPIVRRLRPRKYFGILFAHDMVNVPSSELTEK